MSLPDKFDSKRHAIEESNDLTTMSPDILSSKLRIFEMEMDLKKSQKSKNKTVSNDTNLAFSTMSELNCDRFMDDTGEINVESLDGEIAMSSKHFKKIVKFCNNVAPNQLRMQNFNL